MSRFRSGLTVIIAVARGEEALSSPRRAPCRIVREFLALRGKGEQFFLCAILIRRSLGQSAQHPDLFLEYFEFPHGIALDLWR